MTYLLPHLKAVVAFLTPAVVQLRLDLQNGLTAGELFRNFLVSALTSVVVWSTSNDVGE